jgi:hypothetical protein
MPQKIMTDVIKHFNLKPMEININHTVNKAGKQVYKPVVLKDVEIKKDNKDINQVVVVRKASENDKNPIHVSVLSDNQIPDIAYIYTKKYIDESFKNVDYFYSDDLRFGLALINKKVSEKPKEVSPSEPKETSKSSKKK